MRFKCAKCPNCGKKGVGPVRLNSSKTLVRRICRYCREHFFKYSSPKLFGKA